MKLTKNLFYWALIAVILAFILYQKGIIFANFDSITPVQAYNIYHDKNVTLLDVRTPQELKKEGKIDGALNIPVEVLSRNIDLLTPYKKKRILVYCRSGSRSVSASRLLSSAGFKVFNLSGGILAWKKQELPLAP